VAGLTGWLIRYPQADIANLFGQKVDSIPSCGKNLRTFCICTPYKPI